jgi:hypothetical protein
MIRHGPDRAGRPQLAKAQAPESSIHAKPLTSSFDGVGKGLGASVARHRSNIGESIMTFHPEALDMVQLKRLAKQMSRGSKAVLADNPLSLAQSQELLARTLGYENWHAAWPEILSAR